jgi:NADH-quinone oxidoreductase subunit I
MIDAAMAERVIVVNRKEKLGWAARLYLPTMLRGLAVTARHFTRNLRGLVTGKGRRPFVVQYPEERLDYPDAFRGMPVLVAREDGSPRCVSCGLCAIACPTSCIEIEPTSIPIPGDGLHPVSPSVDAEDDAVLEQCPPERFDIDMSRCIFCGVCEEVCPEVAIVMSGLVELAAAERDALRYDLDALLVPADFVSRRLNFLQREPASGDPGRRGGG